MTLKGSSELDAEEVAEWLNETHANQEAAGEHFGAHPKTVSRVLVGAGYHRENGGTWSREGEPVIHLTAQEVADWCNANEATLEAAAEHFGRGRTTLEKLMRRNGFRRRHSGTPGGWGGDWTQAPNASSYHNRAQVTGDEIAEWANANSASLPETAEHFGIASSTVQRLLKRSGWRKKNGPARPSPANPWVQSGTVLDARPLNTSKLGNQGWSTRQIEVSGMEFAAWLNLNQHMGDVKVSPVENVAMAAKHFGCSENTVRRKLQRDGYARDAEGVWQSGQEEAPEMSDSRRKERARLVELAEDQGWQVTRGTSGRIEWRPPKGRPVYENPNDQHYSALRKQLVAAGLKLSFLDRTEAEGLQIIEEAYAPPPPPKLTPRPEERSALDHALHDAVALIVEEVGQEDPAFQALALEGLGQALLQLEEIILEMAENYGRHRTHVDDVIPPMRRDIQELKDAPKPPTMLEIRALWNEVIGAELLKVRVDFDRQLANQRAEMETQFLEMVAAVEAKVTSRDPLGSVRALMNGNRG